MDTSNDDDEEQFSKLQNRRSKQYRRSDGSMHENDSLMNADHRTTDDSDVDQSVNRLCQFLDQSGSDDDDDINENLSLSATPLPKTGVILNSRQRCPVVRNSVSSTSPPFDDNNRHLDLGLMDSNTSNSSYFRRMPPPDFLNIPPPPHPPDESPQSERRPLPPNRTLPPVPNDEPQYEEAKPPPPAPRPSKQHRKENKYHQRGTPIMNNNLSSIGNNYMNEIEKPQPIPSSAYVSQGSQYNDVDWNKYETSILERNADTGSFYIPSSGHTTMSTISPSRKSELEQQQNRHNYSLLPSAQTTVPVPVLPMRPQMNVVGSPPRKRKKSKLLNCTWKCLTYSLAIGLVFALAVICYLLVIVFTPGRNAAERISRNELDYSTSKYDPSSNKALSLEPLRPLPDTFDIGDHVVADLPPGVFRHTSFNVQRNSFVQFNLSIEPQAKLAIYGRQTLPPSPTEHDFTQIIVGAKLHASPVIKRSALKPHGYHYPDQNLRSTMFVHYLLEGRWHLALLNDDQSTSVVRFSTYLTDEEPKDCKYNCYEKGVCEDGKCFCFHGYSGAYCEETVCPVLCSGNGIFTNGKCHCHQGWKGTDCNVPSNVCEVPNCNRNGQCNTNGECVCDKGYRGKFCNELDCVNTNCTNHGVCVDGKCFCDFGWRGDSCDIGYTSGELCPAPSTVQCSSRGSLDRTTKTCLCDFGFFGEKCEKSLCNFDCGTHGRCENNNCLCDEGWTGNKCSSMTCAPGCEDHGSCINGTCVCNQGWNGENCLLEGCMNDCNKHGQCEKTEAKWQCLCDPSFIGTDCGIPLELQCSDKIDNDNDLLTDCEDSECCSTPHCQDNTMCQTVPDPHQVLIRMQAPPPQSSFFQKTRFLLDADSLQHYSDFNLFNESRAAVIRGRTVNAKGGPLMGVRVVDTANALYGFTLSRSGGWFDLMVNGGGSVTLHFMRLPFGSIFKTVGVPWNEIVYIGDVQMASKEVSTEDETISSKKECSDVERMHNIKPYVVPSWTFTSLGMAPDHSGMVSDAEALEESVKIAGTEIFLTYFSANAAGHESTLRMYLVPTKFPPELRLVKLVVDVEGIHFEQIFEAKSNLTFTYGWDMRNIYKQKVFGLTLATVSVGYIYHRCPTPIWIKQKVKLSGHRSSISDLGGWNLNIHHKYDILNGVVEKGDGSAIYLKEQPPLLMTTLDLDKIQKKNSPNVKETTSFVPNALAVAKDGGLFVGDQNSIKLVSPNGDISVILQLNPSDVAHQYYLAVHPLTSDLYISLASRRQIWRVHNNGSKTSSHSYEIAVGTGEACLFDDDCGDGGSAESAKLSFPKGIAFDSQGNLFIADERKIRTVSTNGLMSTIVGENKKNSVQWRPLECRTEFAMDNFRLQWPTTVVVREINDKLMFLDGDIVFELISKRKIRIVAGTPTNCASLTSPSNETLRPVPLKNVASIATTLDGKLLVAETDGRRLHRIRVYDETRRRIQMLSGAESNCDCSKNCPCDDLSSDVVLARNARLNRPTCLTVDHRGFVHVADQGNFKVRTIRPSEPDFNSFFRHFEIFSPESQEVYMFNRHGQHVATKDLITDKFLFNFTYHVDSSYGTLVQVSSGGGRRLTVGRKDRFKISLENSDGLKSFVHISRFHQNLEKYVDADGASTKFKYENNNGLLISKQDSVDSVWLYEYDGRGHLASMVVPTGETYSLKNFIINNQMDVNVYKNDHLWWHFRINDNEIDVESEFDSKSIFLQDGGVFHLNTDDGASVQYDSGTHSLLEAYQSSILRRKLSLPSSPDLGRKELTSTLEWRYHLKRVGRENRKRVAQVGRKTRINGVNLLNIEYDRETNKDVLFNQNGVKIFEIQYNNFGDVVQWKPTAPTVASMNISFDTSGRTTGLQWGSLSELYMYDSLGRTVEMKKFDSPSHKTRKFTYSGENTKPIVVELPSGDKYQILYDAQGRLTKIISPSSHEHIFIRYNDFGSTNFVYSWSASADNSFIWSKNFDGSTSFLRYPSGEKVVTYENFHRKTSKIFYDDVEMKFEYDHDEASPSLVVVTMPIGVVVKKSLSYQGHLLVHVSEERNLDGNLQNDASFAFQYDDNLRLTVVQSTFDQVTWQPLEMEYDTSTGRLIRMSNYRYEYLDGKIRFFDDRASSETILSPTSAVALTKLVVKSRTICEQRLYYDAQSRLVSVNHLISSDDYSSSYEYDENGRLTSTKIKRNNEIRFDYQYDDDGNLNRLNNLTLTYDADDDWRLKSLGNVQYKYDTDGFLVQRGASTTFEYDSLGRLIRGRQKSPIVIDNRYFYDDRHRLIALKRSHVWYHFWYARPDRPHLITHMSEENNLMTIFVYDQFDRLFALERGGQTFYVIPTPDQTPQFVFAADGTLTSWIYRTPLGEFVPTSNAEFSLPVGFKGQFQDFDLNVAIFARNGRPYDTLSGRWMSVNVENLFHVDVMKPEFVNHHIFNYNDPINVETILPKTFDQWALLIGYDFSGFIPMLIPSKGPTFKCHEGNVLTLASECSLLKKVGKFHIFESLQPSALSHSSNFGVHEFSPTRSIYGDGTIATNVSNKIVMKFADADDLPTSKNAPLILLNGSTIVPLSFNFGSKSMEFYWKPDGAKRLTDDLAKLGVPGASSFGSLLPSDVNWTISDAQDGQKNVQIWNKFSSVNVHYGGDLASETMRILRFALTRTETLFWTRQYLNAVDGHRSNWTDAEFAELLSKGKIDGYYAQYVRDPLKFLPKLAADPNNLRFYKRNS